jgi:hypothetical protein
VVLVCSCQNSEYIVPSSHPSRFRTVMDFVLSSPGKPVKGRWSYHITSKITIEIVKKFSSLMFGVRTYSVRLPFHLASLVYTKLRLPSDMMEYMNKERHQGRHTLSAKVKHIWPSLNSRFWRKTLLIHKKQKALSSSFFHEKNLCGLYHKLPYQP